MDEIVKQIKAALEKQQGELAGFIEKSQQDQDAHGKVLTETKESIQAAGVTVAELEQKLKDIEQKVSEGYDRRVEQRKSAGQQFAESEMIKNYSGGQTGKFEVKTTITDDGASAGDILQPHVRPGIQSEPQQELRIRDLLTVVPVSQSSVEYAKELVFTNAAAIQTAQGAAKAESAITFELATAAIRTLAHWIPVSKQIVADIPALRAHVDGRLMYGLKLVEEDQILNGDGTGVNLDGLLNNATDNGFKLPADSIVDVIRKAILTARQSLYPASGIVLNPADWAAIELTKTTDGAYVFANPQNSTQPRLWGLPVVQSDSLAAGTYLVGGFMMGAEVYDREQMSLSVSEHHSDYFVKNLVAVLCEERIGLAVRRPAAFVQGAFAES